MKVRRYPKGPFPLPLIGNAYNFPRNNIHLYFDSLSERYGPCFTVWIPVPVVVFTDYTYLKEAYVTQPEAFLGRSHMSPDTILQKHLNTGVLFSDGETWRTQRRTALKIFRDFGMGKNLMEEQVSRSISEMMEQLKAIPEKTGVDMFLPLQLCVGNVINETLLGYHFSYKDPAKFEHIVNVVSQHLILSSESTLAILVGVFPFLRYLPYIGYYGYRRIEENIKPLHDFIEDEVAQHVKTFNEDSAPENFVHAYLAEMRKSQEGLDMKNLTAIIVDFWVAGMETTSTSLRWHILYMIKYPEVQRKVREEVLRVVGSDRMPSMTDKPSMPYTQAVIHEVQRHSNMIPALPPHKCFEDVKVFDKNIPAGTLVFGQIWSILKHDEAFKESETFNPDRYLQDDGKTINKMVLERTVPFSIGKRACAGEGLARLELFLIFASLIQKFEFVANEPIDMTPMWGGVLNPKRFTVSLVPVHSSGSL
ncbi:unnamed protein product [Caenorhabditis auriculariae]|uniref:Unspecific monooxygenase n=1 Tax=Caenorhabditis auriculariae TaxID=2777116 RepID=A0A8S1HA07_9PELO|nr:unnamed protein product [Caenorhabditis auriculariae]